MINLGFKDEERLSESVLLAMGYKKTNDHLFESKKYPWIRWDNRGFYVASDDCYMLSNNDIHLVTVKDLKSIFEKLNLSI